MSFKSILLAVLVTSLMACSSAPTWKGMTESEISSWKANSFDAEQAQAWKKKGFTADDANVWAKGNFSMKEAGQWSEEKFTAEEAKIWKVGGFSLEDAVESRAKGLTPVQP